MLCHLSHGTDCPKNVRRSCDSHWDLIACIIGYLNSDLTVPPKIKTPPSSSSSSSSTSIRERSPHPALGSEDISPDEDENIRPPFHKLRRHRTQGSPPPPIASLSWISPQIGSPPKLEPVGDIGYETASGGKQPNLEVLAQTHWTLATCWFTPSKRNFRL